MYFLLNMGILGIFHCYVSSPKIYPPIIGISPGYLAMQATKAQNANHQDLGNVSVGFKNGLEGIETARDGRISVEIPR